MLSIKQDALAFEPGEDWNQQIEVFNNTPLAEIKQLHEEKMALYERMLSIR